jgi:predicted nuclease with TOPRIM domain
MSILAILAAAAPIIQAGATIASGVMNNKAIEDTNNRMIGYYEEEQEHQKKLDKQNQANTERAASLSERNSRFQMKQVGIENARYDNETNYKRLQTAADKYAEYLNNKSSLKANNLAGFQRG